MPHTLAVSAPSCRQSVAVWLLQSFLAGVFLAVGGAKLAGAVMAVEIFDRIGLGQWLRIVTGLVEVGGALALLIPGFAGPAALWLACTMIGAVAIHVTVLPSPAAPAVLLLTLNGFVASARRDQILALLGRFR